MATPLELSGRMTGAAVLSSLLAAVLAAAPTLGVAQTPGADQTQATSPLQVIDRRGVGRGGRSGSQKGGS